MNGKQHFAIGLIVGGASVWAHVARQEIGFGPATIVAIAAGALVGGAGALLPDIDHPGSTVSNKIPKKLWQFGLKLLYPLIAVGIPVGVWQFLQRGTQCMRCTASRKKISPWWRGNRRNAQIGRLYNTQTTTDS